MTAWLADAARATGYPVVELQGWHTRGRSGPYAPRGVLIHHTAFHANQQNPFPARATLLRGRPDLPGPLCQMSPAYDGTLHVIAGGRANHAGKARASGPMPAGDGNALYVGLELDYSGTQDPSPAQYRAAVALAGQICLRLRVPATHVRGHRETSVTGKWDPGRIDMDQMRRDVAAYMANPTAPSSTPRPGTGPISQEDDVSWNDRLPRIGAPTDPVGVGPANAGDVLRHTAYQATAAAAAVARIEGLVREIHTGVAGANIDLDALLARPGAQVDVDALAKSLAAKLDARQAADLAARLTIVARDGKA